MDKLTQKQATTLCESNWWEGVSDNDVVMFQLHEERLCMPMTVFHAAMRRCLKRPIFLHEMTLQNLDALRKEFLGEKRAPTFEEIINLIPESKRLMVITSS